MTALGLGTAAVALKLHRSPSRVVTSGTPRTEKAMSSL